MPVLSLPRSFTGSTPGLDVVSGRGRWRFSLPDRYQPEFADWRRPWHRQDTHGLHQDYGRPGRYVDEVAQVDSYESRRAAPIAAESSSIRGKLSVSIRADTGGMTVAPGDEQHAQHLQRDHDGPGQHQREHGLHPPGGDSVELGNVAVEGGEQELLVGNEQHQSRRSGDDRQGHEVTGRNTPVMLPKRAVSKSRVKLLFRLIRTIPTAKLAVVMTPMAAS